MIKAIKKYVILLYILPLIGCAAVTRGYGTFVPDQNSPMNLEALQIDPDMNYYFSGPYLWPDAIIGVKKAYTLDSTLWKKIDVTPELVQKFISFIKSQPSAMMFRSYAILDSNGKQIGVWYSSSDVNSYIRMEDERTVDIATPINPTRPELTAP